MGSPLNPHLCMLIVDDDPGDVELFRRMLARIGERDIELHVAHDPPAAHRLLGEVDIQAIWVDQYLGSSSGLDLIRSLRHAGDDRAIILLTGGGNETLAVEAMRDGADDYLTKSALSPDAIRRSLALGMAQFWLRQERASAQQALVDSERRHRELAEELAEANRKLSVLATVDSLTGLANRRQFDAALDAELRRARRKQDMLSLLFCDVDFFKPYNDQFGHLQGDACLQTLGQTLRDVFQRAGEVPARYGGEEFAVILPGVPERDAIRVAEKLRRAVADLRIPHQRPDGVPFVTLSLGLVSAQVTEGCDATWFLSSADQALILSKQQGRNRTTVASLRGALESGRDSRPGTLSS